MHRIKARAPAPSTSLHCSGWWGLRNIFSSRDPPAPEASTFAWTEADADHVRGVSRAPTDARRRTIVATKAASKDGDVDVSDAEMTRLTGLVSGKIESNDVVVWAKSWCPYCDKVKALFETMEVTHLAVDLDKFNEEKALVKVLTEMTGQRTVPNVFIGGAHVGGCDDTMALKDSGNLQRMLKDLGVSFKDDTR